MPSQVITGLVMLGQVRSVYVRFYQARSGYERLGHVSNDRSG
jgi:hypothetical protein